MYSNKCAARRTSIEASRARVLGERREVQGCWTSWNQKVIALDLRAWFAECREQLAPQWIVLPHHANCKPALAGSTRALCIATIPTQRVKASSLRQSGWPPCNPPAQRAGLDRGSHHGGLQQHGAGRRGGHACDLGRDLCPVHGDSQRNVQCCRGRGPLCQLGARPLTPSGLATSKDSARVVSER